MKSRQWLIAGGLLAFVLAAVVFSVLTRDLGVPESSFSSESETTHQTELVDERPLQTARAMAKLPSNSDEQRLADVAMRLADNEVDLAFHDALRDAADHPPQSKPQNRGLYEHAGQAEAQVKEDQTAVDELKKRLVSASDVRQENLQEKLDLAQAQLELDQDELNDAKEDLVQSGADPGSLIQRQFDEHQAAEHTADQKPAQAAANDSVNYHAGNLIAQFAAWRALRNKTVPLEQARDEAVQAVAALTRAHGELAKQVGAEKVDKPEVNPQATTTSDSNLKAQGTVGTAIKSLHLFSDDHKNLADLEKRTQDLQQLRNSYTTWIGMVQSQQRAALHGMSLSALWILLIILSVYLADRAIDRYLTEIRPERTRLQTLRAVIRFVVQAVGAVLILLVILGTPSQVPTILGLAGAGLTVALKDFIVAFFGWFVLMGKNGLRVGDWVEINGVAGEVVEINLLRTVLLETGNWTDTGHPTGRKVAFVNSYAIEGHFFNFTTSGQWMWDELEITVPFNQDPYPLLDAIQKTVAKETETNAEMAAKEWESATSHYKVRAVSATPEVNLRPTAAGVEVHVRYITRAQERSAMRARLNQALVQLLHQRGAGEKSDVAAAR